MGLPTVDRMGDATVGLFELEAWIHRCEGGFAGWSEASDAGLREHYTVLLIVRMLVFSHEPPSGDPRNPVVDDLVEPLEPCLEAAHAEAARRVWESRALRAAAREVLSPSLGAALDPVANFCAG